MLGWASLVACSALGYTCCRAYPLPWAGHFSYTRFDDKRLLLLLLPLLCTQLKMAKSEIPCPSDGCPLAPSLPFSLPLAFSVLPRMCGRRQSQAAHTGFVAYKESFAFPLQMLHFRSAQGGGGGKGREKRRKEKAANYKGRWQTRRSASTNREEMVRASCRPNAAAVHMAVYSWFHIFCHAFRPTLS